MKTDETGISKGKRKACKRERRGGGKTQKEGRGRREEAVAMEIIRRDKTAVRPVTRNEKVGDLRKRDQDVTPEIAGLEA